MGLGCSTDGNTGIVFGKSVGRIVLPAQNFKRRNSDTTAIAAALGRFAPQSFYTRVPAGPVGIETLVLIPWQSSKRDRIVIRCAGNGEFLADAVDELTADSEALGCAVMGFSYPGVGGSSGTPKCAADVVHATRNLVVRVSDNLGMRDVVLKGHSLGGAIAVQVAAAMHREGRAVRVFVGRSFADVASVASPESGIMSSVYPLLKAATWLTGWDLSGVRAFEQLPTQDKLCVNVHGDLIIPQSASLFSAVSNKCLMLRPAFPMHDPHNAPLGDLRCVGRTGDQLFWDFARG